MACDVYSQEVLDFQTVIASAFNLDIFEPIVSTASPNLTPFGDSDFLLFEEADSFLALEDDPTSSEVAPTYQDSKGGILLLEAILNSEPPPPLPNQEQYLPGVRKELKLCEDKTVESSVNEPPEVELKELPPHLEYAFLEGDDKLPVIIAKDLKDEEKAALLSAKVREVLGKPGTCVPRKGRHDRITNDDIETDSTRSGSRMAKGIVLGHKISKSGIEVDRAKVEVIAKLPHPTTDFPDCEDSRAHSIHMSFTSSASFWESMISLPERGLVRVPTKTQILSLIRRRCCDFPLRSATGWGVVLDGSTALKAATYKRGLSILEAQVVKYKESEVLFSEEIALLKRSVGHKDYLMGLVKTELEKVKEEKEGFEFKLAKFEKSSKDLDDLLASQVTDKSKRGFGYTVVPSPHPLILNRPTPLDLSYSGLEEFKQPEVNEYGPRDSSLKPTTVCNRESNNSKENTDDSLTQQPKTVTKLASVCLHLREHYDAPIIEDWVSDDEEDVVYPKDSIQLSNAYKIWFPRAVLMKTGLKTVKNAKPFSTVRSVNTARPFSTARSVNTVRPYNTALPKSTVSCARPKSHFQNKAQLTVQRPFYKNTTLTKRSNIQNINTGRQTVNTVRLNIYTVRARGFNAVKPSTCWVWRPIKPNGASLSNSQLNDKGFVDSGCSRA
ncbi:hypothetical protein Tco_1053961 [Tanacetum coccineum]|uniref:Reverse transcriptase domain-containing protein n=1 Tax=Tanacetum coccineum TaxID=301880 RepID=A0ABQ5GWH0_9ASTR